MENFRNKIEALKNKLGEPVDEKIEATVVMFNAFGLRTTQFCEGHADYGEPAPWVEVYPEVPAEENWQKNEELRNKVLKEKQDLEIKAERLFQEFYRARYVPDEVQLKLEPIAYGFRVQSTGLKNHKEKPLTADQIHAYKEEMADFTNFLREKYLKGKQ